ncbi:type II CAAX endopeptidase family protein [Pontiellaceae bacterium B1224]|nr:type II CAAX endopeptidase family protein [Pontiellaceae bacterium B1224]
MNSEEGIGGGERAVAEEVKTVAPLSVRATICYTLLIGVVSVIAQTFFIMVGIIVDAVIGNSAPNFETSMNGNVLMGAVLFSYPVILGMVFLIIRSYRGLSVPTYLGWQGWRSVSGKAMLPWMGGVIGLMMLFGIIRHFSGETDAGVMEELFKITNPHLLLVTMVFGAPLVEELFFRGFMFRGLEASKMGAKGAVIITTLLWVLIHGLQYDLGQLLYLLLLGLLLGFARLRTGAVCLPLSLHVVNNMIAVVPALIWGLD